MMYICVIKLTTVASDNGLLPGQCQAIIWINAGILLIGPLGSNFSEILIEIHIFIQENAFVNLVCKMAAVLSLPQRVNISLHIYKRDGIICTDFNIYHQAAFSAIPAHIIDLSKASYLVQSTLAWCPRWITNRHRAELFVKSPQIARFMRPTWGPPGSCRPQMGPMLAPWALLSGTVTKWTVYRENFWYWESNHQHEVC